MKKITKHLKKIPAWCWLIVGILFTCYAAYKLFSVFYTSIPSGGIVSPDNALSIAYYRSNTFNGWLSPVLLFLASILSFAVFYSQYSTNKKQDERMNQLDNKTNFYTLLENHHKLIQSLSYPFRVPENYYVSSDISTSTVISSSKIIIQHRKGQECFWQFTALLILSMKYTGNVSRDVAANEYNKLYKEYSSVLSHYLRNVYHLLMFIDECDFPNSQVLTAEQKDFIQYDGENTYLLNTLMRTQNDIELSDKKYELAKLFRAHLSSDELLILALNGLTNQGNASQYYLRKYRILKNMNVDLLPGGLKTFLLEYYPHLEFELR